MSPVEEDTDELFAIDAAFSLDVELLDHAVNLVLGHVLVELLDDGAQVVDGDNALSALVEQHEGLEELLAWVARSDVPGRDALEALARQAQVHDARRCRRRRLARYRRERCPVWLRMRRRLEGRYQIWAGQAAETEGLQRVAELGKVELVIFVHIEKVELEKGKRKSSGFWLVSSSSYFCLFSLSFSLSLSSPILFLPFLSAVGALVASGTPATW